MVQQHTFPQDGDNNDAANFAQLFGHTLLADYVTTGLDMTVDYTIPEVSISDGVCMISRDSDIAETTGETRLKVNHVLQIGATTVGLTDGDVNYIYVEPQFNTNDSGMVTTYTSTSSAPTNALKIGEIDTTNDTKTQWNRVPSVPEIDFTSSLSFADNAPITFGDENDASVSYTGASNTLDIDAPDVDILTGTLSEQGNRVATRSWTNANADVPNADYADSAGDADTVDGQDYADIQTWVNGNSDVPNADYADNADQLDSLESTDFAREYEGVQAPVYASKSDVPSTISVGEIVYIDGVGLHVEDGT